ncbi:MAG: DNA-methyltransferase [Sedimentisphaerales bacterium]
MICEHCQYEFDILPADVRGGHRLLCGDSTSGDDLAYLMGGEIADIVFTSPPYNAGDNSLGGNKNMTEQKYANDSDDKPSEEYLSFLMSAILNVQKHSLYQFINIQQLAGNKIAVIDMLYALREHFCDVAIWYKGGGQPAMCESVMNSRFEYIFIFAAECNPKRQIKTNAFRDISNVFELNPSGKNDFSDVHAAVFPVEFAEHFISMGAKQGAIVLEPFCGSGTTIIASQKLGRRCMAVEIDPLYVDICVQRWEDFTGKKAIRIRKEQQ